VVIQHGLFYCVFIIFPWLCMKRKYIILSLLISGPKQPGNDIDVYLAPLLEDLNKLWKDRVRIFDAYLKEYFIFRAVIFCTINDFPTYGNLSGHRTK
jgi:Transposase family tnp2